MSKYSSICTAINLIETIAKMMKDNGGRSDKTEAIIKDLQDIAKDVRYGGEWEGDYEMIAYTLKICANAGEKCAICPYKKEPACRRTLKTDAAAAIRQLGKSRRELEMAMERVNRI